MNTELMARTDVSRSMEPADRVMAEMSKYISRARDRPLPEEVLEKSKEHALDTLAAMISGSQLPPGRVAIRFAGGYGGERVATVVGSRILCGSIEAALAKGVLVHSGKTDDSHAASQAHPGCSVVPATLALGETCGISGTHFLRAGE